MTTPSAPLWTAYLSGASTDRTLRNSLVEHYHFLVERTVNATYAQRVRTGEQHFVCMADLEGAGAIGLIRGVETFRPERGVKPETWIAAKIRGAVLDALRQVDHLSRRDRDFLNGSLRERGAHRKRQCWSEEKEAARRAKVERGARIGAAVPFSVIEAAHPEMEVCGAASEHGAGGEMFNALRDRLGGTDFRVKLALVLHHFEGFSVRKIAVAMGYQDRPRWLRELLSEKDAVTALTERESGYSALRYGVHGGPTRPPRTTEAREILSALRRARPGRRGEGSGGQDGALPRGAGAVA